MQYPEHDKLSKIKEQSQWLGGFIDWLNHEKIYTIAEYCDDDYGCQRLVPAHKSIEKWLADYFKIDLSKLEEEKLAMLAEIRKGYKELAR